MGLILLLGSKILIFGPVLYIEYFTLIVDLVRVFCEVAFPFPFLSPNEELKRRVKNLNVEIKNHYVLDKRKRVRKGITPGDSRSLWKAVNIAKDKSSIEIPTKMSNGAAEIDEEIMWLVGFIL